mgnify:CR=1 FL=1
MQRLPKRKVEKLRAWDAADEYLLQSLSEHKELVEGAKILLLNDHFGALAVALHTYFPYSWSDSHLGRLAVEANYEVNGLVKTGPSFIESTQVPDIGQAFDIVVLKVPKTLALLEYQLSTLQAHCSDKTLILAGGMTRGIHNSTLNLFEKYLGPCTTSLARKKARLIFCERELSLSNKPVATSSKYLLENTEFVISNQANVFSRESLDIGTRFFLAQLKQSDQALRIVDLGCGNGVVGLIAAKLNPNATILFRDESYMALASAEENFRSAYGNARQAEFCAADCLGDIPPESVDIILNNPPFHQNNAVGEFVAWQMFQESLLALKKGGELWVIGNRHLAYHSKLKKLFGRCDLLASNKKFVVLKATKAH